MFTVTDGAKKELDAFFADKEKTPVRVYLAAGGCAGPRLALALDDPMDDDSQFDEHGFKFIMEAALYEKAQDITIDAGYMGFTVESTMPLAPAGGGCAGCGGGCHA